LTSSEALSDSGNACDGKADIRARKGLAYQILVDGQRIIDVKSQGTDVVPPE
jgi:hypothetical protein